MTARTRIITRAGAAAVAAVLVYKLAFVWPTDQQLTRAQARFLTALAENDRSGAGGLVSYYYRDRWGFDRLMLVDAMGDVARQFIHLEARWSESGRGVDGGTAVLHGTVALDGRGNALGQQLLSRANRLEEPFAFTWKKESWTPWSWKLVRIDQPELEVPRGYSPGSGASLLEQIGL